MSRVVDDYNAGLGILGYRFLPRGAFDQHGNLVFPGGMNVPPAWSKAVGRVTAEPAWEELFTILGPLTVPGTAWTSWRVAVGFNNGVIRVVIARDIHSVRNDPRTAANWSDNLWSRIIVGMQAYAGRRHMLPQGLVDPLATAADGVKNSPYWTKEFPNTDAGKLAKAKLFEQKWRTSAAVDVVLLLARVLTGLTTSGRVLATVLWFDSQRPSRASSELGYWRPLHATYDGWDLRCQHYWWNSGCRVPGRLGQFSSYPFVYSSVAPKNKFGLTDLAHLPWELCQALYPDGAWQAPATAQDIASASDEHAPYKVPSSPLAALDSGDGGPDEQVNGRVTEGREVAVVGANRVPKEGAAFVGVGHLSPEGFSLEGVDNDVELPDVLWLPTESFLVIRTAGGNYRLAGELPSVTVPTAVSSGRSRPTDEDGGS